MSLVPYRRGGFRGMGATPDWAPVTYVASGTAVTNPCDPFDSACMDRWLGVQRQTFQEDFNADLAQLRENCNRDWALNDSRYASLGITRPPNNCAERSFGLTPPGYSSYASPTSTYTFAHDYPAYTPPAAPIPQAATIPAPAIVAAPRTTQAPASTSNPAPANYIEAGTDFLQYPRDVAGFQIPTWGLIAAGVGALFLFKGGR